MTHPLRVGSRSRFVTVTAWLAVLLGLLALGWAVVQSATVSSLPALAADAGWLQLGLRRYLPWLAAAGLLLSVALLVTAVGLLRRLDWARRGFIGLLGLAVVVNLAGLWLQQAYMLALVDGALQQVVLAPPVATVFGGFVVAARTLAVLVTLAASGGLGWMAWRLTHPSIRQEFA